ncbi:hypothetical protein AQUCO_04400066v1 [Aquilegia coerulea]|uniref:H15 domain-containing protein n=1 Tax=Aquilegia coerulea TaxID=218851 RepID=A0A2G5CMT8_AQUCA|nr:hypothetical protein AQUCO_04400066v1 [Aquilegia coerulea]
MAEESSTGSNTTISSTSTRKGVRLTLSNSNEDEVQSHADDGATSIPKVPSLRSYRLQSQPILDYQMVLKAIKDLNEENGSSEETILEHIVSTTDETRSYLHVLRSTLKHLIREEDIEQTPESKYVLYGHYVRRAIQESDAKLEANPKSIFQFPNLRKKYP